MMNIHSIVSELKAERNRISRAITILEGTANSKLTVHKAVARRSASLRRTPSVRKVRHHLTAAGRRKLSRLVKQRWAERKKKANGREAKKI
jgi:hypothetical protein